MHTSAEARLNSVAIRIRICIRIPDPDRHQNLIFCSLAHCQRSLKISCKSVRKFLRKVANRQTDKQTTTITYPSWRTKNNLKLECGPMPNVMVALPNIGGALCSTPQSLADAHY